VTQAPIENASETEYVIADADFKGQEAMIAETKAKAATTRAFDSVTDVTPLLAKKGVKTRTGRARQSLKRSKLRAIAA